MLLEPECNWGYTTSQLEEILGDRFEEFGKFMVGQTMTLCEGRKYNHETKEYEESCGGVAHGGVVYPWDLDNFLRGGPILD